MAGQTLGNERSRTLPPPQGPRSGQTPSEGTDSRITVAMHAEITADETDLIIWDWDGTVIDTEPYHLASFLKAAEALFGVPLTAKAREDLASTALGHGEVKDSTTIIKYMFDNWRELGVDKRRLLALQALPELEVLLEKDRGIEEQIQRYMDMDLSADRARTVMDMDRRNPTCLRLAMFIIHTRPQYFEEALKADPKADLREDVRRLLLEAKMAGIPNAIVTGSSFPIVECILDHFKIQEFFDPALRFYSPQPGGIPKEQIKPGHDPESYGIEDCKPSGGCYTKCLKKAGVPAERAAILENSAGGAVSAWDALTRDGDGQRVLDSQDRPVVLGKIILSPDGDHFEPILDGGDPMGNANELRRRTEVKLDDMEEGVAGHNWMTVLPSHSPLKIRASRKRLKKTG